MIRFLIDTTVSKRDGSGNCYHYSMVISTKTGRSLTVSSSWGSDGGNISALLLKAGLKHSEIHSTESVVPIREYNRQEPDKNSAMHEHEIKIETLLNLEKEG